MARSVAWDLQSGRYKELRRRARQCRSGSKVESASSPIWIRWPRQNGFRKEFQRRVESGQSARFGSGQTKTKTFSCHYLKLDEKRHYAIQRNTEVCRETYGQWAIKLSNGAFRPTCSRVIPHAQFCELLRNDPAPVAVRGGIGGTWMQDFASFGFNTRDCFFRAFEGEVPYPD